MTQQGNHGLRERAGCCVCQTGIAFPVTHIEGIARHPDRQRTGAGQCGCFADTGEPYRHRLGLQFAPRVHHRDADPEHNNAPRLVGLEYESPSCSSLTAVQFLHAVDRVMRFTFCIDLARW